jgi:hypothetical protein
MNTLMVCKINSYDNIDTQMAFPSMSKFMMSYRLLLNIDTQMVSLQYEYVHVT